jgi:hypothetical protein
MVAGKHGHGGGSRQGGRAPSGDGGQLDTHTLEPTQRAPGLGQVVMVGGRFGRGTLVGGHHPGRSRPELGASNPEPISLVGHE